MSEYHNIRSESVWELMAASSSADQVCHEFARQESKASLSTHCESKVCSQSKVTNDPNSGWSSQNQIPVGHNQNSGCSLKDRKFPERALFLYCSYARHSWEVNVRKRTSTLLSTVALPVQFPLNQNPESNRILVLWPTGIWFCDQPEFGFVTNRNLGHLWICFDCRPLTHNAWKNASDAFDSWRANSWHNYLVCGWWSSHQLSHSLPELKLPLIV